VALVIVHSYRQRGINEPDPLPCLLLGTLN